MKHPKYNPEEYPPGTAHVLPPQAVIKLRYAAAVLLRERREAKRKMTANWKGPRLDLMAEADFNMRIEAIREEYPTYFRRSCDPIKK